MRTLSIIKYVFTLVGLAMLAGAALLYMNTRSFIAQAVEVEGTVVELSRSSGSTLHPVVRFVDRSGQTVEFRSSTGSNPPAYARGERVIVLYSPANPYKAEIKGFFDLWGGAVIVAGLGTVFTAIGAGFFLVPLFMARRDEILRTSGTPIETDFQSVELDTAIDVNGQHPFRVLTQWQNPSTSEIHVFKSHNLWFDPTRYIDRQSITVYIARGNPKKYLVDLSFLPKLAS